MFVLDVFVDYSDHIGIYGPFESLMIAEDYLKNHGWMFSFRSVSGKTYWKLNNMKWENQKTIYGLVKPVLQIPVGIPL